MVNKNEGPTKILVESSEARVVDGMFYLEFQSGAEKYAFAIPLPMVKVLGPSMAEAVTEIEKQTGQKFDGGVTTKNIISPWSGGPTGKSSK